MNIDLENLEIIHNEAEDRFETWIDQRLSKLDYHKDGDSIAMTHVGVHPMDRGRGVAGKLTQVALDYARQQDLRVLPICPYIASYIRRNPEYIELTRQRSNS